jgi:UDP-glucose 4-epimerase
MKWLITGGAGYIGSHVMHELLERDEQVVILDSMVKGRRSRIPKDVKLYENDLRDNETLSKILALEKFDGVFHLAALKSVPESFLQEDLYFEVNTNATISLFDLAEKFRIRKMIFSSTAAVYSASGGSLKSETDLPEPTNPYGKSKLTAENSFSKYLTNGIFEGTSLRYFNVIGSSGGEFKDTDGDNLVPKVITQIKKNVRPTIYGSDYKTSDGTCVRDYVDVRDIARAHVQSALASNLPNCINIGTGKGNTVLEVVKLICESLEVPCVPEYMQRRNGDVESIVADISLASEFLSYSPKYSLRDSILSSI